MHARTAPRGWFGGRACYCADDWCIDKPTWIPLDISDCVFLRKSLTLYHEYYWSDVQIGLLGYMAGKSRARSHQTRSIQNWPFPSMWPFLHHDTSDITVSSGASTVFGWLANMTSVAGMLNWICLCITSIRCVPLCVPSGNLNVMLTMLWYYFSAGRFRRGLAVCLVSFLLSWNTSWIFSPPHSRPKVFPSPSCHTEAGFSRMRRGTGFCELYFLHPFSHASKRRRIVFPDSCPAGLSPSSSLQTGKFSSVANGTAQDSSQVTLAFHFSLCAYPSQSLFHSSWRWHGLICLFGWEI